MSIEAVENGSITVGGCRIAYTRAGRGSTVVLLHGIPTSRHLWRNVVPVLASSGREVIALDLLGYGDSDKPQHADLGIRAQAEVVVQALRSLGRGRGTIVGHDIGGGIAQLIALDHPELVSRLILVDSVVYDSFPEPGIARLKEPVWDDILGAPDFDLKKGLSKGLSRGMVRSDRITPELIEAYERPFAGIEGRRAYLRAARALRTEELAERSDAIEKLETPTLLIWGAKDAFQPMELGARLASSLRNGGFEIIDRAGHFLPEDAPDELATLIVDFTGSVPSA